jgi:hypothetical protein
MAAEGVLWLGRRKDEGWKIYMHCVSVFGFFWGGFSGWYAFHVSPRMLLICAPTGCNVDCCLTAVQQIEHLSLLVSVALTSLCGVIHTLYVSYHEHISFIAVLEANTEYVVLLKS